MCQQTDLTDTAHTVQMEERETTIWAPFVNCQQFLALPLSLIARTSLSGMTVQCFDETLPIHIIVVVGRGTGRMGENCTTMVKMAIFKVNKYINFYFFLAKKKKQNTKNN